ncbi:membrane protein [Marinithermofilum abyssi]|uniref:Membrane protein n=1 Tax=Marinithermofilum abyssi TaxID=1571185 RepID=A0A8J2VFD9_9BACL|nr:DUF962 domain-containing protein [Marinithermofilum abyssi]GGE07985.1 membrane protein [Marinithermofilum abyssi]
MEFKSFEEFWPFYVSQHSKPETRRWHFVGTASVVVCLGLALWVNGWFVLLAPVIAYGLAWYSHFFVEGNKPATFGHPLWSLLADFRMFVLMLTGKMDQEVQRLKREKKNQDVGGA